MNKEHKVIHPTIVIPANAGNQNSEMLSQFKERRAVWKQWLVEDEEHSIQNQIDDLVFDHAVYKCLRVASSEPAEKNKSPVPPIVRWCLDRGYVANQFMGIRRLCDNNIRNDSITIRGLLNDLKENIHLFTRENFVCYDEAPLDPTPEREKHEQEIYEQWKIEQGTIASSTQPFMLSEDRHTIFDKLLCIVDSKYQVTGKLDECLTEELMVKVGDYLSPCAKIKTIASKYHAHASDKQNRDEISEQEKSVTFNYLEKCHLSLCRITNFIGSYLLNDSPLCIAYPQFQVFEGFDEDYAKEMENNLHVIFRPVVYISKYSINNS